MKAIFLGRNAIGMLLLLLCSYYSSADTITEWNANAQQIIGQAKLNTAYANRAMALTHTAMYEACNAITKQYTKQMFDFPADNSASVDAAIAKASRDMLLAIIPNEEESIEYAFQQALAKIENDDAKMQGIEVGKQAAMFVLKHRKIDFVQLVDRYRPDTQPGVYVPTTLPAVSFWSQRTPWFMRSASQFRAPAPPELNSEEWAKDYNEVKAIGAVDSKTRTVEQTEIAKFWQATLPPIYHGIIGSVANQDGRTLTQNARLYAIATRAIDDALIAVFEAKYFHKFWRPITAIRNADNDGNDLTDADNKWMPYIPTPMHPEYPCAHCVVASTLGNVLKAELAGEATPKLITTSSTSNSQRTWDSLDEFMKEVSEARIYDGVHYRASTDAGNAMGEKIAKLAVQLYYE